MKMTKLLAALALVLPVVAHAGGWYAGLDMGSANSDARINEYGFFGDTTARGNDTTTSVRVRGGYQFGRFFALEVAYVDFGTNTTRKIWALRSAAIPGLTIWVRPARLHSASVTAGNAAS